MTKGVTLTQKQEAQIYCIKNGHAKFVTTFMGYVHCGRCGQQIGDTLGGVFDLGGYAIVGHSCGKCDEAKRNLSKLDKEIFDRLEVSDSIGHDYEKILKGLSFKEVK